jgi:hypothetical protein
VVCEGGDDRGGVSSDLGLAVEADDDAGLGGSNGNTITALAIYIYISAVRSSIA